MKALTSLIILELRAVKASRKETSSFLLRGAAITLSYLSAVLVRLYLKVMIELAVLQLKWQLRRYH